MAANVLEAGTRRWVSREGLRAILAVALGLAASSCGLTRSGNPAPQPVVLQLSWYHQAQFAGFYAADQNGYYGDEGLAVSFVEGGPSLSPWREVVEGRSDFGVTSGDQVLVARAEASPVVALATIYRRSPRVFIALPESGIRRPQDFVGHTISVGRGGSPFLDAMMQRLGISPDQYTVVESTPDLAPLYQGEVQVRYAFLTNEVITAQAAGYALNVIYPDDYGIHFYSDTLFTNDELLANDPDLALRFVRATLKGWTWAAEHPAAIGPMVQAYAPQADAGLETAKMTASLPLINTGEDYIGWMKPEIWAAMEETLREQGVLTSPLDVESAYTLQFLQEIYGK